MHVAAEAAARHEHQALASLGELVGKLHGDPAPERVPDDRHPLVTERGEEVAHSGGVRAERIVAARRRGLAVAEQVGCDEREALGQQRRHVLPGLRRVGDAVQQQEHGAATGGPVRHPVAVQRQFMGGEGSLRRPTLTPRRDANGRGPVC